MVGMLILNRILSSVVGILMITELFDPRGKSKKTKQLMYGTIFIEIIVISMCYFYGSQRLLGALELIVLASLFFSFYPLFYASAKKWVLVFLTLANLTIFVTMLSGVFTIFIVSGNINADITYCIVRFVMFFILGIIVKLYGKEMFENICDLKFKKSIDFVIIFFSIVLIPLYLYFLFRFSRKMDDEISRAIVTTVMMITMILICYFFYFITKESLGRQEQMEYDHNEKLLRIATSGLVQRVDAVEEYIKKIRVANHDRRHFNAMLLELLNQGDVEKAKELLQEESSRTPKIGNKWCENATVNVAIGHYLSMAEEKGISLISRIDVPKDLKYDSIGFSMMLGNLVENAIQACEQITNGEKLIWIKVIYQGQFLIEIENTIEKNVELDKNGCPVARRMGHGFGTKSVVNFVQENGGEILYLVKEKRFSVRIILP